MNAEQNDPYIAKLIAQSPNIQLFLVGGSVRDTLLGIPTTDRDWVVVGGTSEHMKNAGFRSVGKDFPVFIHPTSSEEYALARQERKVSPGYQGFAFNAGSEVTLEQDLMRRDFTINAIAQDPSGKLIDPLNGTEDIRTRQIKHVSNAFVEDPLRVLRAARFAAKLNPLGFTIAESTLNCLKEMANSNELHALTAERVWLETNKALKTQAPQIYFSVLHEINALPILFPELAALYEIKYSPNASKNSASPAGYALNAIQAATKLSPDPEVRFAALLHNLKEHQSGKDHAIAEHPSRIDLNLNKEKQPASDLPQHMKQPRKQGEGPIHSLCNRLKAPKNYLMLAEKVSKYHNDCHRILESTSSQVFSLLKNLDAFRNTKQFHFFLTTSEAIAWSKNNPPHIKASDGYLPAQFLRKAHEICSAVNARPFIKKGLQGKALGEAIAEKRQELIESLMQTYKSR